MGPRREEAAAHVVKGQFELAIPAAQYALRFGSSVYGDGSVELVPAYLLVAEANLGLARYAEAEAQLRHEDDERVLARFHAVQDVGVPKGLVGRGESGDAAAREGGGSCCRQCHACYWELHGRGRS